MQKTGFLHKNKAIFIYGISSAVLLLLLKWLEWRFMIVDHAMEIYIGAIALIFTLLGIWLALKLSTPKVNTVIVEKEVFVEKEIYLEKEIIVEKEIYIKENPDFTLNEKEIEKLGLSKREIEVLELMSEGFSNQEIGERLFVSLNTIKTHSGNIFVKLDVKRRTQAVEKAKRLSIIR
ncbi:MAG: LuxR C-terminal-related transcriptional regulator [Bacteroidota bacterium]|nr:LuxR C-terminal-related transcriptional regulator [Bacteroidota bacterium]